MPTRTIRAVVAAAACAATTVALLPAAPSSAAPTPVGTVDCAWTDGAGVTLDEAFARSARASGVPVDLLKAVSYQESRWDDHAGRVSADGGYGPMNLTDLAVETADGRGQSTSSTTPDASAAHTLPLGAGLTGQSAARVRTDPAANVCAGAAVLASYREPSATPGSDLASWVAPVTRYGAAGSGQTNQTFASQVFTTLKKGAARVTSDGSRVRLTAQSAAPSVAVEAASTRTDCPKKLDCQWVPAPYLKTDPADQDGTTSYGNHDLADRTGPGGPKLDYIVIHDTEGSWDSALNLVQDPTYLAWNYTVRSSDGQIAQHLNAKDIGYHAGNWYLNMHSIGIEHEGKAGTDGWFTEAMYENSATLVRYLAKKYDIPLDPAHVIGHDQVPGILPGSTASMHWDPGPYWDWEHYFDLLGAPIAGRAATTTDVAVGDVVTVRPGYAGNDHPITQCEEQSPGSGACQAGAGTDFAQLYAAPSTSAPLAADPAVHPTGSPAGTTVVSDVAARAQAGNRLVVAAKQGAWVQVAWAGGTAWLQNPAADPVLVRTPTPTVTLKPGATTGPVYGRAYPEAAAYPATIPPEAVTPIEYTIKPGQTYAVTDPTVVTDYYRAKTYDGSGPGDRTDVRGNDVYYQVALAHRVGYVRAADVVLHPVPVLAATTKPTIDGRPQVGEILTGLTGRWTGGVKEFAFRWQRDGRDIRGATDQSYAVRRADRGHRLRVVVTASAPNATSGSATSAAVRITPRQG